VELCTELFYAIIPTLFLCMRFAYPHNYHQLLCKHNIKINTRAAPTAHSGFPLTEG